MINLHQLKAGDIVLAKFEEQLSEGKVLELDMPANQACVLNTADQENWYGPEDLFPIPLTEEQLIKLKFKQEDGGHGEGNGRTWVRGPFTVLLQDGADPHTVLHYRDETRNIAGSLMVHELQNHYQGMTLFHLE